MGGVGLLTQLPRKMTILIVYKEWGYLPHKLKLHFKFKLYLILQADRLVAELVVVESTFGHLTVDFFRWLVLDPPSGLAIDFRLLLSFDHLVAFRLSRTQ